MGEPAQTYDETESDAAERQTTLSDIRDKVTPGIAKLPRIRPTDSVDRVPLPIRLPRMYHEALKEYSLWSGQSMNALAIEAIGDFLRTKTKP